MLKTRTNTGILIVRGKIWHERKTTHAPRQDIPNGLGARARDTVGHDRISVNVLSPASDTNHERTQTATKQWLHSDRLGSTVNSTDSFGRVTERTDYNEWGEITYHAPIQNTLGYRSISTDRTYTNHDYDVVLGLYYAKARMYDAGDKRFVPQDSAENPYKIKTIPAYKKPRERHENTLYRAEQPPLPEIDQKPVRL